MAEKPPLRNFQHGGGGHLEKWRRTVMVEFFAFSMSLLVWVPNLITVEEKMAEIKPLMHFQHGRDGHLGKWRRTVGDAFFEISILS